MTTVVRHAFAKVNLDLRVLGVRPDGYHELVTVFQTISLHDEVRIEATHGDAAMELTCSDPSVPTDHRNLAWRAAARLWTALGRPGAPRGVSMALHKGIPAQGGLGGGSADAAVVLQALHEVWGGGLDGSTLGEVAAGIGADVAFFLCGGTARGGGRGDELEPWPDLPPAELVVVQPPFGVPTVDAYRWFDAAGTSSGLGPDTPPPDVRAWLATCRNDLEAPVVARHPQIGQLLSDLRDRGAHFAMMSGSGSTVFGIFPSVATADAAALACRAPGLVVRRARTVGRAEYVRAALGGSGSAAGLGLPPASSIG